PALLPGRIIGTGGPALWQDKLDNRTAEPMKTRAEPSSKSLSVNGLRLHYLEWGKPGALPVICVHGYTSSAQSFNALARHLADRVRLIAVDVRGHGESQWSAEGAYRYADQAADLAALADTLVPG